jgi:hypothetical protein
MSVKTIREPNKLILELDNGDLSKFDEALKKWSFKDEQSMLRFLVSLLLLNENKFFSIKKYGTQTDVVPIPDLLKD